MINLPLIHFSHSPLQVLYLGPPMNPLSLCQGAPSAPVFLCAHRLLGDTLLVNTTYGLFGEFSHHLYSIVPHLICNNITFLSPLDQGWGW